MVRKSGGYFQLAWSKKKKKRVSYGRAKIVLEGWEVLDMETIDKIKIFQASIQQRRPRPCSTGWKEYFFWIECIWMWKNLIYKNNYN